ncbi:MAG: hypothetical protein IKF36_06365 [Bacilli bacterium]|nr:hypothetical protein [Bacilli bacterium]
MKVRDKEYSLIEEYKKSIVDDNISFTNDYETISYTVSNTIANEIDELSHSHKLNSLSVGDLTSIINKYLITEPIKEGEERIKPLEEYYIKELKDFTRHQIKTINNNIYVDEVHIEGIVLGLVDEMKDGSPISTDDLKSLIADITFKVIESLYRLNPGDNSYGTVSRDVELQASNIIEKNVVALKESSDSLFFEEALSMKNKTRQFKEMALEEIQMPKRRYA